MLRQARRSVFQIGGAPIQAEGLELCNEVQGRIFGIVFVPHLFFLCRGPSDIRKKGTFDEGRTKSGRALEIVLGVESGHFSIVL